MIKVTRLNGKEFYINPDLIEFIESTPDTVITMTTNRKVIVMEDIGIIIDRIIEFRKKIFIDIEETCALDK
ncbi:MAG TPA: flagellar FlbD family protein [Clostridiales bacterium]|nr:flagellar FlbD family protein [Clostridiales bacterium]